MLTLPYVNFFPLVTSSIYWHLYKNFLSVMWCYKKLFFKIAGRWVRSGFVVRIQIRGSGSVKESSSTLGVGVSHRWRCTFTYSMLLVRSASGYGSVSTMKTLDPDPAKCYRSGRTILQDRKYLLFLASYWGLAASPLPINTVSVVNPESFRSSKFFFLFKKFRILALAV